VRPSAPGNPPAPHHTPNHEDHPHFLHTPPDPLPLLDSRGQPPSEATRQRKADFVRATLTQYASITDYILDMVPAPSRDASGEGEGEG
jgi:hypothetical protein